MQTIDYATLSEADLPKVFEDLASEAARGSGSSYDWYLERLCSAVNGALAKMPESLREKAKSLATKEYDYLTPAEMAAKREKDAEDGYCIHGLDEMTCPAGCFE